MGEEFELCMIEALVEEAGVQAFSSQTSHFLLFFKYIVVALSH